MLEIMKLIIDLSLTIRKMKTRWGVCNYKTKRVTLNFNLIKKDIKYLDYVIVHELSHLLYPNHSKNFWKYVKIAVGISAITRHTVTTVL